MNTNNDIFGPGALLKMYVKNKFTVDQNNLVYLNHCKFKRGSHDTKDAALGVQYDYLLSNGRNPLNELLLLIEVQLQRQPRMHF